MKKPQPIAIVGLGGIFPAAALALLCAAACGKKEEAAKTPEPAPAPFSQKADKDLPVDVRIGKLFGKEAQDDWLRAEAKRPMEEALGAADRKELVRPAPAGFKPEPVRRKAKLTLIPRKTVLKKGEVFWYRLELQNLGNEAFGMHEQDSFWKLGNHGFQKYRFYITPPGEAERKVQMYFPFHDRVGGAYTPIPGEEKMTPRQIEEAVERMNKELTWKRGRKSHLQVNLAPGETLVSRPWVFIHPGQEEDMEREGKKIPPVPGEFRELVLRKFKFDKPGTCRIRAIYHGYVPKPPDEEDLKMMEGKGFSRELQIIFFKESLAKSLGNVESNSVTVQVEG